MFSRWLKICAAKSRTKAFTGKHPIRTKTSYRQQNLKQSGHFNYLGCDISYKNDADWEDKLAKFRGI